MLLAVYALALSLMFGATSSPTPPSVPQLPPTQPGLSHDEGVFLVTAADDGSQAIYFVAGNARHSVLASDMQLELQVNPLWPVRQAGQDEVLGFPEGGTIGAAHPGLVGGTPAPADAPVPAPAPAPVPATEPAPAPAPAPEAAPAPAAGAPAASPAQDDAAPATYTLRPGDNLTHIARDYGTSIDAILVANGLPNANRIYAGQTLLIPTGDADATAQADAPAAPFADAPAANTPTAPGATAAPSQPVAEAPADAQPAPVADAAADAPADSAADDAQTSIYTVAPGDSAFKIARRFGIDQGTLLEANSISNPNRVYVGQVLTIPSS